MAGEPRAARTAAREAALGFVAARFPACQVALLAGSVAAGSAQKGADLDIVVLDEGATPHWATHEWDGWPLELFALTPQTYHGAFALDRRRRWPLHLNLCRLSQVLVDRDGLAQQVRDDAQAWYDRGPASLDGDEVAQARYVLTWMIDDLVDAASDDVASIGHELAIEAVNYYLSLQGRWLGKGKWWMRQLREADPATAVQVEKALAALRGGDKTPLLTIVRRTLDLLGGRGFAGQYFAYRFD